MPSRVAPVLVLLVLLQLLASAGVAEHEGTTGTGAPAPGFFPVGDRHGTAAAMDLAGASLVWAVAVNRSVEILRSDLEAGTTTTLTRLGGGASQVSLRSIAYDGRWVVWIDDRFGNAEVFALDVTDGSTTRVTEHPGDDSQVDVADGLAVWNREGVLHIVDLGSGERSTLQVGVGPLAEPSIGDDGLVAWSQAQGDRAVIAARRPGDEQAFSMPRHPHGSSFRPQVDGARIVWTTIVLGQDPQAPGVEGAIVQMADLAPPPEAGLEITYRNLTTTPDTVKSPSIGGDRVAWLRLPDGGGPANLIVRHLAGEEDLILDGPISAALLSQTHIVVVRSETQAAGVWARAWDWTPPEPGRDLSITWPAVVLGLLLVGAGIWWGKRRGEQA